MTAFPVLVDQLWSDDTSVELDGGELRRADGALLTGASIGDGYGARGGIARHSDNSLRVSIDATDQVTVKAGPFIVPGTDTAKTGPFRGSLADDVTAPLPLPRNATNPRLDVIVIRSTPTRASLEVVSGPPAASPQRPDLGSNVLELATITVPPLNGPAATLDETRRIYAAAIGAILPVPTKDQLPTTGVKWQLAQALNTGAIWKWNGVKWTMSSDYFTGAEGNAIGTAPPAGTEKVHYESSAVVLVNGAGNFTVPFPVAFDHGVVSIIPAAGDSNLGYVSVINASSNLASWNGVAFQPGSTAKVVNTLVRINYQVTGW